MIKANVALSSAVIFIILTCFAYYYHFSWSLSYEISNKPNDWALFGSYLSGILTPILSFISIVLLIGSLTLQREANTELKLEIERNKQLEKVKSFESQFFHMIDSQKKAFQSFELVFLDEGRITNKKTVEAVYALEDLIHDFNKNKGNKEDLISAISALDEKEQIYSIIRVFYIIVKTLMSKLSDEQGFDKPLRLGYIETLINFTEYPQLRLVLIAIKYQEYYGSKYLGTNDEFMEVINSLGMGTYLSDI